jgi:hypothetical protein
MLHKQYPQMAVIIYSFTPHTSGQINVTVTSHNFKPYESTITVNTTKSKHFYH